MSGCRPNFQSTLFDQPLAKKLPTHLGGLEAPLAVWEYVFALLRRIETLERAAAGEGPEKPPWDQAPRCPRCGGCWAAGEGPE